MQHSDARVAVDDLAATLFPRIGDGCLDNFRKARGYHVLDFDEDEAFSHFETRGPAVLDGILNKLPGLAEEFVLWMSRGLRHALSGVKEGSWVLAQGRLISVSCRLSSVPTDYIVASPGFALLKNLDTIPMQISIISCRESFETDAALNVDGAIEIELNAGDTLAVNGFKSVLAMRDRGLLMGLMTTEPLGAYQTVYSLVDGRRAGNVASELRTSSIAVALRTFAAAGWHGATDLCDRAQASSIRELRWTAMNYAWRAGLPDLRRRLGSLTSDPDLEIRQLAQTCLGSLDEGTMKGLR